MLCDKNNNCKQTRDCSPTRSYQHYEMIHRKSDRTNQQNNKVVSLLFYQLYRIDTNPEIPIKLLRKVHPV